MRRFESVAIVGVGLIGASLGMALKRVGATSEVIGIGRSAARLGKARRLGAIDRASTQLARGVASAELVVLCTPVDTIAALAAEVAAAAPAGCLITDAGSTKQAICAAVDKTLGTGDDKQAARFVGSHPLAGSEQSGCEHARHDLLAGHVAVVTPTRRSRPADVERVDHLWEAAGMEVVRMSPLEHDRAMAATSHLPHLAAAAIAASTPQQVARLLSSGWLDTTRIAAGDARLWRQILLSNRRNVLASLDRFERSTAALRRALEREDGATLERLLSKAKKNRDAVGS